MIALSNAGTSAGPATTGRVRIGAFDIDVWDDASQLETLVPAWDALAGRALEPAPSTESWMLLPSLRHAIDTRPVRVVTLATRRLDRLVGVFPLAAARLHAALPVNIAESWNHMYAVNATPLVDAEQADDVIDAFLQWAARSHALLRFPELRTESELFARLSAAIARRRGRALIEHAWSRAFFRPAADGEAFIAALGSAHHRKEWRRQERRLSEQGRVVFDHLAHDGDLDAWLAAFIAIEASGWKGREGTAFGAAPAHRAWLAEVSRSAFARGRLDILAMRFEGKPIAMRLSLLSPPGAYAFKIAYDEAFLRYSPGVLLELENIRRLHAMPEIRWMDSLAVPGHSLMERVWPDRAPIVSLLVAPGTAMGRTLIAVLPRLRALKRVLSRRAAGFDSTARTRQE